MRKPLLYGLVVGWFVVVLVGFAQMAKYQATPGQRADAAQDLPATAQVRPVQGVGTIVMFIHPQCPCTQASLSELERLLCEIPSGTSVYISCLSPDGDGNDWTTTSLVQRAKSLSGVTVLHDSTGEVSAAFGPQTSGETFVYDKHRRMIFHGGITASRGHEGDNAGRSAIASLLNGVADTVSQTPVFGCPLVSVGGE